ncbi:MAG: type II toxin-antitoxin system RatA family toxin [Legionellales bacterium]|nr:type II toxin-antitoxin system RatA family toxin [Legionellales bacterium]
MPEISRQAIVPYTCAEMFDLVNDIEAYPQFIPWCQSSTLHSHNEHEIQASLCFARGGISKCFTTCNRMQRHKMIQVKLISGPFKRLEGYWLFDALNEKTCRVSLNLEFEFAGKLISLAFGPLFQQVANTLVDSFRKRAIEVYGKRETHD